MKGCCPNEVGEWRNKPKPSLSQDTEAKSDRFHPNVLCHRADCPCCPQLQVCLLHRKEKGFLSEENCAAALMRLATW